MQVLRIFIGVDVSKAELIAAVHGQPGCHSIANDAQAIGAWLHQWPAGSLLAMESTGRFHQLLATLARQAGLTVFVLNARDVFFYAKGMGARAKTDRVDASVIARYLAEHHDHLHCWQIPGALHQQLQCLLGQRHTVVAKQTALRESLRVGRQGLEAAIAILDNGFKCLLKAIDQRIAELFATDQALQQRRHLLSTIVGIGPLSSALLADVLSRVTFANADALVAYSGLDPRANDSGRSRGRRRLSKRGNPALRHRMFMAAMSACHTKTFAPLYQQLRARGLKTTEALVVLARKLLRIAFAVWTSNQPFDPHRTALPV